MKKILMITPFFAPYSHAAVYRAHRFAKFLPRFGWKPYVLTVDRSFLYFIDEALLKDLPDEIEITRARHIDWSFTGFKSVFRKTSEDSGLIKGPRPEDLTARLGDEKERNLLIRSIGRIIEKIILPDRYNTWYPFAMSKARKLMDEEGINVIYSTSSPYTSHLIAMKIKKQFKTPWVADFRDTPLEDVRPEVRLRGLRHRFNAMIEKDVMKNADIVLTISEEIKDLFLSKYKGIVDKKIRYIETGADAEVLQGAKPAEKKRRFRIVFSGEFWKLYTRRFFEILNVIFKRKIYERSDLEVLLVGSIKRNIFLKKEIEALGLIDVVRLVDYRSLKEYFGILLSADATLVPGVLKYQYPIKLADYLLVKKPIITFDLTDEIYEVLLKSGLGVFVPNETEKAVEVLADLLMGRSKFSINEEYINKFSAFNQTKEFCNLLEGLIEKDQK